MADQKTSDLAVLGSDQVTNDHIIYICREDTDENYMPAKQYRSSLAHRTLVATGPVAVTDEVVYLLNSGEATVPDAAAMPNRVLELKNKNLVTGNWTIVTGGGLIDGATDFELGPLENLTIHSDGVDWWSIR